MMPSDTCLIPLTSRLLAGDSQLDTTTLWVADEQIMAVPSGLAGAAALTNRWDIHVRLMAAGLVGQLSDFDFGPWPSGSLRQVGYRVSKEKAVVHHVINRALERLQPGGTLWLVGHKQEGVRTYIDKAAQRAGAAATVERLAGGNLLAGIAREQQLGPPLDDREYGDWRELAAAVHGEPQQLWTKPGIFGWQKVDAGSALLAAALGSVWPEAPARVLDLGCGYGYLAVAAARRWPETEVVATDNNVAAVSACQRNLAPWCERASVQIGDCGDQLSTDSSDRFDAILCNPPFHQGFGIPGEMTGRFLRAAADHLAHAGIALFVVNAFIPIEQRARPWFSKASTVVSTSSFKVVALQR